MAKLNVSDQLKVGVQELLLGDVTINTCGDDTETDGLLANHLSVKQLGVSGTIPLIDYIDARVNIFINLRHNTAPVVSLDSRPIPVIYQG